MSVTTKPGAAKQSSRPVYRNIHVFDILRYRLPFAGLVSILHRISGLLLVSTLPLVLYLFEKSLVSEISFATLQAIVTQPLVKLGIALLAWAYLHHFCAGIRYLFLDVHCGLDKVTARRSALTVFFVSLPLTALVVAKLFGAF